MSKPGVHQKPNVITLGGGKKPEFEVDYDVVEKDALERTLIDIDRAIAESQNDLEILMCVSKGRELRARLRELTREKK